MIQMQLSQDGKTFIKWREVPNGVPILVPHHDTIADVWDIAYGHVLKPGEPHEPITLAQANDIFDIDALYYEDKVCEAIADGVALTQAMFDALVSLCYNIGGAAFLSSTLIQYVNAQQWSDAALLFLKFRKSRGRDIEGLLNRRAHEAIMFVWGEYN